MKRMVRLIAGGLVLGSTLVAGAAPAAAQFGGPCPLLSDDALTQALGSTTQAIGIVSNPNAASAGASAIADMCVAQLGGDNALMITHMVNIQAPGDVNSMLAQAQAGPAAALATVDPSLLTVTPISGVGDIAVLLSGNKDGQPYGILSVWRGTDGFSLIASGVADPQTSLPAVAQAILATQP